VLPGLLREGRLPESMGLHSALSAAYRAAARRARLAFTGLLALPLCFLAAPAHSFSVDPVFVAVASDTFSLGWTDYQPGASFVVLSTDNFVTWISSETGGVSTGSANGIWFSSAAFGTYHPAFLKPNTTYYFKVKLDTEADTEYTSFNAIMATSTLAANPVSLSTGNSFVVIGTATLAPLWGTGQNPLSKTTYTVVISTDYYFGSTGNSTFQQSQSTRTSAGQATFFGLLANTTYFSQVRTLNHNGVLTPWVLLSGTSTLAAQPTVDATTITFSSMASSGFGVTWMRNGNPVTITTYSVVFATAGCSVGTCPGNVVVSTNPEGAPNPTYTVGTLLGNTTYTAFVAARNWNGVLTGYSNVGSTSTLTFPMVPIGPGVTTFTVTDVSAVSVAWMLGANPPGVTTYTVVMSTINVLPTGIPPVNGASGNVYLSTAPVGSGPAATLTGLEQNTTYYFFANNRNHNSVQNPYIAMGSTATRTAPPGAAGPPFAVVASSWAMTVAWSLNGAPPAVTTFTVTLATGSCTPGTCANVALSTFPPTSSTAAATLAGLSANTTYTLYVESYNHGNLASSTTFGSSATLANVPLTYAGGLGTFVAITTDSVTLQWGANSNPSFTTYTVVASTSPSFTSQAAPYLVTLATAPASANIATATVSGMIPNTTYYFSVLATNHNGVLTATTILGSTFTAAAAVSALPVTNLSSTSFTVNWSTSGNPAGTYYAAEISTDNFATLNQSSFTVSSAAVFSALRPNTGYYLRVKATGYNGNFQTVQFPSTSTLTAPPVSAVLGAVSSGSVVAQWTDGGNSSGTVYVAQISTDVFGTVNEETAVIWVAVGV
jgi:hypothetical protein